MAAALLPVWLAALTLASRPALALDTLILGELVDAATGQPVVGATVTARFGDGVWRGASDERGGYRVSLSLPGAQRLYLVQLAVEHPDYAAKSHEVAIVDGAPDEAITALELFPRELAACLLREGDAFNFVIVGHFRPPIGESIPDLSERLAEALQFDLLTRMQQLHLPSRLQPVFAPCPAAEPRLITQGKALARALRVHAVLHGNVSRDTDEFSVSALVSDAYDLSQAPVTTLSPAVDLAHPTAAQLHPDTYAAVLAAVAAGIASRRDCAGALAVGSAAEALAQERLDVVAALEARCGVTE